MVFAVSRCKPFFFSSLLLSLDLLDYFQVLDWFCFPLLHPFSACTMTSEIPRLWSLTSECRASEVRSLACMPTSDLDQTHHWATYSTSPTNPPLVRAPFWQPIAIFLWLIYVKWTVLQRRYFSSLASSIDSHWFYLLPLITVSCLNHPCTSSHFIAFKLSFHTFSCPCAFLQQFLSAAPNLSSDLGSVFLFQSLSLLFINSRILDSLYLFKQDFLSQNFRNVILALLNSTGWGFCHLSVLVFSHVVWALFAYIIVTYGSVS